MDSQPPTKGLIKTDSDKSDLVVTYQTAVEIEKQWDIFGDGAFRCGGGMATATTSVEIAQEPSSWIFTIWAPSNSSGKVRPQMSWTPMAIGRRPKRISTRQ